MFIKGDKIVKGNSQAPAAGVQYDGALVAATTTAVGGVLKVQNDVGVDLIITDFILRITTGSTGAATLDIGTDDDGATSSDNIMDGANAQTVKVQNNRGAAGTNGGMALWKNGEYVVATASATTAGMVGSYKIIAIPA